MPSCVARSCHLRRFCAIVTTVRTLDETLSHTDDGAARAHRRCPQLYVLMNARAPLELPSRHALVDVKEVHVGRGSDHGVVREADDQGRLVLTFPDRWMSRPPHARIRVGMARCTIEDVGSRNGIRVNGVAVETALLEDGDLIEIGKTMLLFQGLGELAQGAPYDVTSEQVAGPLGTTFVAPLQRAFARAETLSRVAPPMLILGPTGCGKEVLARRLHRLARPDGPFVAFNCGALSDTLVEAELFGYRRGAFSGAESDRKGLIEAANGGTLFLDEIADLSPSAQAALLRVLQEREVRPVGATESRPVDVRVVAATHEDLQQRVADDRFREDLYGRLAGAIVSLPSLLERRADFGLIVRDLLLRRDDAEQLAGFELGALRAMLSYDWPRNIRELGHALETGLALAHGELLAVEHLPAELVPATPDDPDEALRSELTALLTEHHGNMTRVAEVMSKKRQQIQRWCKRLGINPSTFRR